MTMPTAFETHARRLRFQALGKACRERGINALLMGHHLDDSVETTIWRLSAGHRGPGLAGIPEVARIPECHGIFGVSESGSSITLAANAGRSSSPPRVGIDDKNRGRITFAPASNKGLTRKLGEPLPAIATGGIFCCRPLLTVPKSALIATCMNNFIPWVTDPTNSDPTLTVRNTIRSLLQSNSLPRAFSNDSMLSLIESSKNLLKRSSAQCTQLLGSRCHLLDLNLRTGTMLMQFSPAARSTEGTIPARQIQSMALRSITEIISPHPGSHFPLRSFEPFTSHIFPEHEGPQDQASEAQTNYLYQRKPFTVGGVFFNPLTVEPLSEAPSNVRSRGENFWLLSRQPLMKNKPMIMRIDVPVAKEETTPALSEGDPRSNFTPWTLWDSRFWFRFSIVPVPTDKPDQSAEPNLKTIPLFIRPFQVADFVRIRDDPGTLAGEETGRVHPHPASVAAYTRRLVNTHAPGSTRFTIPVLTVGKSGDSQPTGDPDDEHLLALPTLGQYLSGRSTSGRKDHHHTNLKMFYANREWIVEWEWMYKMIDTEVLRELGVNVADGDANKHV